MAQTSNMARSEEARLQQAAEQFAANMTKYPVEEQFAVSAISKNVVNGCSWEFVRNSPEIAKILDRFQSNPHVSAQEVTYAHDKGIRGYLVSMDFQYMLQLLNKEAPGLFSANNLEYISKHRQEAVTGLAKLMAGKKFKGRIGVYCTNDSSTITKDGKSYPAFAVTFVELLQVCQKCGYGVVASGISRAPADVLQRATAMIKAATVAPSSNALFFDIAPL